MQTEKCTLVDASFSLDTSHTSNTWLRNDSVGKYIPPPPPEFKIYPRSVQYHALIINLQKHPSELKQFLLSLQIC